MAKILKLVAFSLFGLNLSIIQADFNLTSQQKSEITREVERIIYKDRAKCVIEGATLLGIVVMLKTTALPSLFVRGSSNFYISNPDSRMGIGCLNVALDVLQYGATLSFMNFLKEKTFRSLRSGQWNFTLIEFMQKHSRLYGMLDQVKAEAKSLFYQTDQEIRKQLAENLVEKVKILAQHLYYIDGYVLFKIKTLEDDGKFNAKTQLTKEYAVFETTRDNFIEEVVKTINSIKDGSDNNDFQNKVLHIDQLLHYGSANLDQRIKALNFYE